MTENELLEFVQKQSKVVIELGCGQTKRSGAIGIDHLPLDGVDFVADIEQGLSFLPDNSVDEIYSSHLLEHIGNLELLMKEIHRVLKPDGKKIAVVPHFSNPYYYSDYTHRKFFGLYTFDYLSLKDARYKRGVPTFYVNFKFQVLSRKLNFKSPFFLRNLVKQILKRIFNFNPYMQELYESSFCWRYPCQELIFVLKPHKP